MTFCISLRGKRKWILDNLIRIVERWNAGIKFAVEISNKIKKESPDISEKEYEIKFKSLLSSSEYEKDIDIDVTLVFTQLFSLEKEVARKFFELMVQLHEIQKMEKKIH